MTFISRLFKNPSYSVCYTLGTRSACAPLLATVKEVFVSYVTINPWKARRKNLLASFYLTLHVLFQPKQVDRSPGVAVALSCIAVDLLPDDCAMGAGGQQSTLRIIVALYK